MSWMFLLYYCNVAFAAGTGVTEWNLPSGAAVLIENDRRFPVVRVALAVRAGTAHTPVGGRPLAHLAEHLVFRAQVDGMPLGDQLDAAGCEYNATTRLDVVSYFWTCPKDAAPLALRLATAVATHDLGGLDDALVGVERRVVLHETLEHADAGLYPESNLAAIFFPVGHPYHTTERVPEDLLSLGAADVVRFWEANYRPERSVLAVSGDVSHGDIARLLAEGASAGFAHPDQRRGGVADFARSDVGWLWADAEPARWFEDPATPGRPLPLGSRPAPPEPPRGSPLTPAARTEVRGSGIWPLVVAAWYLPPRDHVGWWAAEAAELFGSVEAEYALRGIDGLQGSGCWTGAGALGTMLMCAAQVEDEDLMERAAARLVRAFEGPYSAARQDRLEAADGEQDWISKRLVRRDVGGIEALDELARYRLLTGRGGFDDGLEHTFGGGRGVRIWNETWPRWLGASRAALLFVTPEGREPSPPPKGQLPPSGADLPRWPAPELGPVGLRGAVEQVLPNKVRVVNLDVRPFPLAHWAMGFAPLPGFETLSGGLDGILSTPRKANGRRLYYRWRSSSGDGFARLGILVRGIWDPKDLLRSLAGTLSTLDHRSAAAQERSLTRRWVYAGRDPTTWRDRLLTRAVRSFPEEDGLAERVAVLRDGRALEDYLRHRYAPERAILSVVGLTEDNAMEVVEKRIGAWSPPGLEPTRLRPVSRRSPNPELIVLDGLGKGRTVELTWMCPVGGPEGKGGEHLQVEGLRLLAASRLYQAARASAGLTYTPWATVERRAGGVDLVLGAATEQGAERRLYEVLRGVAAGLSERPAAEGELAAVRRGVLSALVTSSDSVVELAQTVEEGLGEARSLTALRSAREAAARTEAATLTRLAEGCAARGVVVAQGPAEEVAAALRGADDLRLVRVFDWRAAQRAEVERWLPARVGREERFMAERDGR